MIVDDSALMRKLLTQVLSRDPGIQVIDTAMDGQFALDHLAKVRPDVVLMDVDMPRLDGLAALERVVAEYGLPVVMCSSRTTRGGETTLEALARGAVDFVEKPTLEALTSGAAAADITSRVRNARGARVRAGRHRSAPASQHAAHPAAPAAPAVRASIEEIGAMARKASPEIVAIGTSTGGPPALEQVLTGIPADFPYGIVIVQHMPAGFTAMLAARLDRIAGIEVREAHDGAVVRPGQALIAPGGAHMRVVRADGGYAVALDERTPPTSGHRPSVDVLFESVAAAARGRAVALLMTGMGSDGAEALGKLAALGAVTIAQSVDSCVCYGMPKSAIDRGHARAVVPLADLRTALIACAAASAHHTK
jgi:two-component system chemotaxis response regulator CheB